jgi:hypothetical protein
MPIPFAENVEHGPMPRFVVEYQAPVELRSCLVRVSLLCSDVCFLRIHCPVLNEAPGKQASLIVEVRRVFLFRPRLRCSHDDT